MSRRLRWLRLAAVCAVFLVGLPLLLRGRVTAGASVLYNVLLGGTALLLFTPRQGRRSLRRQLLWGAGIALVKILLTLILPLPPKEEAFMAFYRLN